MSDNGMELTRRKILASIGGVGAAGAAAGLGTSALFSDTEEFANNQLTAGQLDLLMDWEEHYSYPQIVGFPDPTVEGNDKLDVLRENPQNVSGATISDYVALPDPDNPVVWVNDNDDPTNDGGNNPPSSLDLYFQNTLIEAFPDEEGGEITANFTSSGSDNVSAPCEMLADVPGDLETYNDEVTPAARTRNADTYDATAGEALPLINLTDVKPGDYGEFTFSAHLCDNDGYLWLQMPNGLEDNDNGLEEPEESIGNDSTGGSSEGELAENIKTALWYDNCNNRLDGEPDPLIALALIDVSTSIDNSDMQDIAAAANSFVESLDQNAEVPIAAGVMTFSGGDPDPNTPGGGTDFILRNDVELLQQGSAYLTNSGDGRFAAGGNLLPQNGDGSTPLAPALDLAREVLNDRAKTLIDDSTNDFGPNTRKSILLVTDGEPTSPSPDRYNIIDTNGNDVKAQNSSTNVTNESDDQFASDVFDGSDQGNTGPGSIKNEAVLVARDIDTGNQTDNGSSYPSDNNGNGISGSNGVTLRTVGIGTSNDTDLNNFLTRIASNTDFFYNPAGPSGLQGVISDIVSDLNVTGPAEKVIFRGTLADLASELDPGSQGPLPLDGNRMATDYDEINGSPSDGPAEGRECFNAAATHCFGLAWWVPASVGNEIQGDSVSFDLGFYTEQCRNNPNPDGP